MSEEATLVQATSEVPVSPVEAAPEEPSATDPVVEAKKAEDEKVAARFAALAREEKRVRMEREAARKEKAEIENLKVKWAPVEKGDPVAFRERLAEQGIDAEEWVRRFLNEGKPTTESKLEALERKVHEYEERIAKQAEEDRVKQESLQIESAKDSFLTFVETNAEKFPYLYEYSPNEIKDAGWRMVQKLLEEGAEPTQEDIAAEIEKRLLVVAKEREERRAKLQSRKAPQALTTESTESRAAKTLTNAAAAEKAVAPRSKTPEEIDAECLKIIQASFR